MSLRALVAVLALATVARPASAAAQDAIDPFIGRTVGTVGLVGESGRPETSPTLVSLVDVHEGDTLRVDAVRSSVAHLFAIRRLEDIEVTATDAAGGRVDLVFKLVPRHPIDKLEVTGDTGVTPDQLKALLKERFGGRIPTEVRLQKVSADAKGVLADEGYLRATATPRVVPNHATERATLVVDVEAGTRARITNATVTGTSPFAADEILSRVGAVKNSPYRARALLQKLASIRDDLRGRGYYEARTSVRPLPSEDGQTVDLTLTVDAGQRVLLQWAGDPAPSGDTEDYVPIRRNSSADQDLLDDSDQRLRVALQREGYKAAEVSHTSDRTANDLIVTFTIRRGLRYRIDRVEITGNNSVPAPAILDQLGLVRGDVFWENQVAVGQTRVVLDYQRRGFHKIETQPVFEELPGTVNGEGLMLVRLQIIEGPKATIMNLAFTGPSASRLAEVRGLMRSTVGMPYVLGDVQADRDAIELHYRNLGFQTAAVVITPTLRDEERAVALTVDVKEGAQIIVEDIRVIGNSRVQEKYIRDEIRLREGQPLGEAGLLESQRRLQDTGLFRSVVVAPEPLLAGETHAHVMVIVEEAPATTIGGGGGLQVGRRPRPGTTEDFLDFAPRGFFSVGRRSLWGKNRSLDFFARLSFRPRAGQGDLKSEYLGKITYSEPRAFHSETDFQVIITSEQALRSTFAFVRHQLELDFVRQLTPRVTASGRYALSFTKVFNAKIELQPDIDRFFPKPRLSTVSIGAAWDRRDNALTPSRGSLISGDGELALRAIGSEVGYAKTFLQASAFRPLTSTRRFVLAGRAEVGMAHGFERTVLDASGQPTRVADIPASQRFFAGGSTTVRGFQLDRLGVPEILNPDGLSNGGNGLLIFNGELRTIIGKLFGHGFGVVGFVDSGNVFAKASDLGLSQLRNAAGFGFRYDSPIGPLRLDFGFNLDRRIIAGKRERGREYHLSLGEAF